MKIRFERDDLARVLSVVERVLPRKSALPFYQALYITKREGDEVEIRVTNGDQYLSLRVDAAVEAEEGEGVALPGEEFIRMVKVAPSKTIEITSGSDRASVVSGGADWVLRYLTGVTWADAPNGATEQAGESVTVTADLLLKVLRKVQYAVARTQNRPSFQQIMVGAGATVAADGRRCHVIAEEKLGEGTYLIPGSVLDVVIDLLQVVGEGPIRIESSDEGGWVSLRSSRVVFITGRLAYTYPDVLEVMVARGRAQSGVLRLNRQQLVTSVRVADTAQDEGAVKLSVYQGRMKVESESSQMRAQMEIGVESEGMNGQWEAMFTADLLAEMLGAFDGETIEFRVAPDGSGVLYVEDGVECSVLMPIAH